MITVYCTHIYRNMWNCIELYFSSFRPFVSVWRYQMLYNTILTSWWWAKQCSKHVEEYNKLIIKQEFVHLMFIGPCIILIVEYRETNLKSLALLFHYLMLNMFRMLIHPSSGACDLFVELFHWLYCSGSMCVGVTVWFGWGGVVSGCRLKH